MKGRPKIKCDIKNPCITHKDGKYLKWRCGESYSSKERHKRFINNKINCSKCGKKSTKSICQKCYYKYHTHHLFNKKLPKWWCKKISDGQKKYQESPLWKGENATYGTKHKMINRQYGNHKKCYECGIKGKKNKGGKWTIQWANISGNYKRDIKDYKGLCTKCHSVFDGKTISFENIQCGTVSKYRKGCRCDLCKKAKHLYRNKLLKYSRSIN